MNESTHRLPPENLLPTIPEPASVGIADGVRRSLDPRAIPLHRVVGCIVTACVSLPLGAAVGVLWGVFGPPAGVAALLVGTWATITGALGWWLHKWPVLHHRHASYTVNPDGIEIRNGVVWRKAINVPRSRVQHTDVSQGPLERRYGLGTLGIYTAGTDYAKVSLDGLAHETALEIRDHLLPLEGADAV